MRSFTIIILFVFILSACSGATPPQLGQSQQQPAGGANPASPKALPGVAVLAVETFLADIAQNVAGERLQVTALIPAGLDPHAFEPTPLDVARIAQSQVLIVNGAGFESWLFDVLGNTGGNTELIEAADGLEPVVRQHPGEPAAGQGETPEKIDAHDHAAGDPHFWLDPLQTVQYVENIRLGLTGIDPAGAETYAANAAAYTQQLKELDAWIEQQVAQIPPERRLLVTNHESLGYFADRYGFQVVGAVIPSVSTGAAPSAQQMAALVEQIRASGAPAIFLETGANPELAGQIAAETGVQVISGLNTHSTGGPGAQSYIEMMKTNVQLIVTALASGAPRP